MKALNNIKSILEKATDLNQKKNDYQPLFYRKKLYGDVEVFDFDEELIVNKLEALIDTLKNNENE